MPTIIRCGGGIPVSDYESLQNEFNNYKSSHAHTNDEYNSYGSEQYTAGANEEKVHYKGIYVSQGYHYKSYYSSVLDSGHSSATIAYAVRSGTVTGTAELQGSTDGSTWKNLETCSGDNAIYGIKTYSYRYYRVSFQDWYDGSKSGAVIATVSGN